MADVFSQKKRSQIMAQVKGKETKPEIAIRKFLFSQGLRYRKNYKLLPGTPDIVLTKYKTVIFVHGCFWHGHNSCKAAALPKSNQEYWVPKIERNIKRDTTKKKELKKLGWQVITVWECNIKELLKEDSARQKKLLQSIRGNALLLE